MFISRPRHGASVPERAEKATGRARTDAGRKILLD